MMLAKFNTEAGWYAAIAAAVQAGLQFEAYEWGMRSSHSWVIEYTGGY